MVTKIPPRPNRESTYSPSLPGPSYPGVARKFLIRNATTLSESAAPLKILLLMSCLTGQKTRLSNRTIEAPQQDSASIASACNCKSTIQGIMTVVVFDGPLCAPESSTLSTT